MRHGDCGLVVHSFCPFCRRGRLKRDVFLVFGTIDIPHLLVGFNCFKLLRFRHRHFVFDVSFLGQWGSLRFHPKELRMETLALTISALRADRGTVFYQRDAFRFTHTVLFRGPTLPGTRSSFFFFCPSFWPSLASRVFTRVTRSVLIFPTKKRLRGVRLSRRLALRSEVGGK